eukprot:43102-Eustigmatos_ZCMA.PRE.1
MVGHDGGLDTSSILPASTRASQRSARVEQMRCCGMSGRGGCITKCQCIRRLLTKLCMTDGVIRATDTS